MLASSVTEALQLQASDIMSGSSRAVDFASLVLVVYIMRELYTFHLGSTQQERTIAFTKMESQGLVHAYCTFTGLHGHTKSNYHSFINLIKNSAGWLLPDKCVLVVQPTLLTFCL